eukprot:TRINITY_DN35731_c0_g1_i1.p1 TRINITY_DN35731_c0_g1~~TRINITY_DN35731_c0_g1_i1.p1  ORF type:complete len:106 (+),score=31.67 TRINITY_DN35731_c0_g1_i1:257-574(+)
MGDGNNSSFINDFDTGENNQGIGDDQSYNENIRDNSEKQVSGNSDSDQIPNKDTNEIEDEHEQIKHFLDSTGKNQSDGGESEKAKDKSRKKRRSGRDHQNGASPN